jgi:hypothetical protein
MRCGLGESEYMICHFRQRETLASINAMPYKDFTSVVPQPSAPIKIRSNTALPLAQEQWSRDGAKTRSYW